MKVVCLDNVYKISKFDYKSDAITVKEVYDVVKVTEDYYVIIDNTGRQNEYFKHRFIDLADWRDEQINIILKDET